MNERRLTILMSSSPTLEDSRSARVLPAETLTTKAQNARASGGSRHCILTTRTIESLTWSRRTVVDGSDGVIAGFRHGLLRVFAGCAVHLTAQYAVVGIVIARFGGYTCVAHGIGNIGQSDEIGLLLGLTA